MLNLRKLKQDFAAGVLQEGRVLFEEKKVLSAKILHLDAHSIRIGAQVLGQYKNTYQSEIEIDRIENEAVDSDCDCPYHCDCQHIAAMLFYIESCLDQMLVNYSKEANLDQIADETTLDEEERTRLLEAVQEATTKEAERHDEEYQKELLKEYIFASSLLAKSPFFLPDQPKEVEKAELAVIYRLPKKGSEIEIQLALRLPFRSKPLYIAQVREFLDALRYQEPLYAGGKLHFFSLDSFAEKERGIVSLVMDHAVFPDMGGERGQKIALLDSKVFGIVLAKAHGIAADLYKKGGCSFQEDDLPHLPCSRKYITPLYSLLVKIYRERKSNKGRTA